MSEPTIAGTGLTNADFEGARLPVSSLNEALPHLRRPFTPEAVKFKVQASFKDATGGIIVAYIDARLVIERLNAVVGEHWEAGYQHPDGGSFMWCRLRVFETVRQDIGESPKKLSKDLVSDSLKRAAVHFGVGVSIYALPQITIWMGQSKGRIEVREVWDAKAKAKKKTIALTEHGHTKLREGYATWLAQKNTFGPPLDHGDVEGQTVDEDAEADVPAFVPETAAALDDDEAIKLRVDAQDAYAAVHALGAEAVKLFPPTTFNAGLDSAAHSHDELRRFVSYVLERKTEIVGRLSHDR